jgi:hypothetical protein
MLSYVRLLLLGAFCYGGSSGFYRDDGRCGLQYGDTLCAPSQAGNRTPACYSINGYVYHFMLSTV